MIAAAVAVLSATAFAAFAVDKRAARRRGARRVPERTLHLLALAGGWPGAWLARGLLRHKTRKPGFTVALALASAANLGAIAALLWLAAR